MRLSELDPRWLEADGKRLGFVFLCPHCKDEYLSCFAVPMPHIAGEDFHDCQYALFAKALPELATEHDLHRKVVPCKRDYAWQFTPPIEQASFDSLSVKPSLDASKSGHWHGHITGGEIK